MKILNLFAGIGGNRSLWGETHQITAVEYDPAIAAIYQKRFPKDEMVIGDAWDYCQQNMDNFDILWASPPCVTHTRLIDLKRGVFRKSIPFPDLRLYGMIIYLSEFFKGKYIVENVIPYYNYLIKPTIELERHSFWTNFPVNLQRFDYVQLGSTRYGPNGESSGTKKIDNLEVFAAQLQIDYSIFEEATKSLIQKTLRNAVNPEVGRYLLHEALKQSQKTLTEFFK